MNKFVQISVVAMALFLFTSCENKNGGKGKYFSLAGLSMETQVNVLSAKDHASHPLASIVNPPVFAELRTPFELKQSTSVHIYGAGETLYDMREVEKRYYLESDDVELFFQDVADSSESTNNRSVIQKRVFSFVNKEETRRQNLIYNGKKDGNAGYIIQIKIPWTNIHAKPKLGAEIGFDAAIGDNDDGFVQEAKICWNSKQEIQERLDSWIYLSKRGEKPAGKFLASVRYSPAIGDEIDPYWQKIKEDTISNVIYGYVKDKFDLSAVVKSCWDESGVYFLLDIRDFKQKYITKKKLKERGIFVDYGWIEDQYGERIWEMNAKYSRHAGGAYKNQKVDTTIVLPAGKYFLRYISDESHAFDNWTDEAPTVPFFGILLYKN